MATNWSRPRDYIIDTAILALRRGYYLTVAEAAQRKTDLNYRGTSPSHACALLERDLMRAYYDRHGGQSERAEKISAMAQQLRDEGWEYIPDRRGDARGGLWYHSGDGVTINQNGGSFGSFEAATVTAYESHTRELYRRVGQ